MVQVYERVAVGHSFNQLDLVSQTHSNKGVQWFRQGIKFLSVDGTKTTNGNNIVKFTRQTALV